MKHSIRPGVKEKEMQPMVQKLTPQSSERSSFLYHFSPSIQGKIRRTRISFFYHSFNTHPPFGCFGRGREESRQIFTAPFHNWVTAQKQSLFLRNELSLVYLRTPNHNASDLQCLLFPETEARLIGREDVWKGKNSDGVCHFKKERKISSSSPLPKTHSPTI